MPLRYKNITAAANEILAAAYSANPLCVREKWPNRWLKWHPEFKVQKEKSIEVERQRAMNSEQIQKFFEKYKSVVDQYKYKRKIFGIWTR